MKAYFYIVITIFIAMLLTIFPLPHWASWVRPEWTLLVLIYWSLAMPERCGVFLAAVVGLFQDSLTASVLGTHVFAYTVAIGFTVLSYKRLRMFDVWQQAGFIFLLVGLEQMIEHWLSAANGYRQGGLWFLLSSVISAFIWPWLMIMLRSFRRRVGLTTKLI